MLVCRVQGFVPRSGSVACCIVIQMRSPQARVDIHESTIASGLLTDFSRQLQAFGVLSCMTGNAADPLITRMMYVFAAVFRQAEQQFATKPALSGIPLVYNPDAWSSEHLCGYAGEDLLAAPIEAVGSYGNLWLLSIRQPSVATGHFLKCALWFYAQGRERRDVIRFALHLFEAGFFIKLNGFLDLLAVLTDYCTRNVDLSSLRDLKRAEAAKVGAFLRQQDAQLYQLPRSERLIHEVLDCLIEHTVDRIEEARSASSLDAWVISLARLMGPVEWLSIAFHQAADLDLGIVRRALLSQIEEIGADLHAESGLWRTKAEVMLPLAWSTPTLGRLGKEYQAAYGDAWIDHLTDERLIVPRAVSKELAAQITTGDHIDAERAAVPPSTWQFCSPKLAPMLSFAVERDPTLMRSNDFDADVLVAEFLRVEGAGAPHSDADDGQEFMQRHGQHALAGARQRLIGRELASILADVLTMNKQTPRARLQDYRELYPWSQAICRISGIHESLAGDPEQGIDQLQQAVLLGPGDRVGWSALAQECHRRNLQHEAAYCTAVAATLPT